MRSLKDYAKYLRENCLKEYAMEYIGILKSMNIPLLKLAVEKGLIKDIGDEASIERTIKSQEDYFLSIEEDTIFEKAKVNLRNWEEDKIPGIKRNEIQPSDLILIYVAQKKAIFKFLPQFTKSAEEAASIMIELETCYMRLQDDAMKLLFKIQQETEQQLYRTEEQFRLMVQSAKDYAMLMLDPEGHVQTWNEGAEKIKGYKAIEIIGKHISIFYTEEDNKKGMPAFNLKMAKEKGHFETVGQRIRKDGSSFWADIIYSAFLDEKGQLKGFFKVTRDITERKRAEEERQRILKIVEASSDFVGFADAKDTHIVYMNPAGRRMTGVGLDEDVTKLKISDVHPDWTNKLLSTESVPVAVKDGIWKGEAAFLSRSGKETPVSMILLSHKNADGELEYLSTVSRDITDIKNTTLELEKKTKELERSNTELEQFAYVASHDLQEPLRTVSSYVQLLSSRYKGKLDKDADEFIDFAVDGSKRMRSLIQSLLEYSRVNRVKPFEWINVNDILDELNFDMQDQIKESGAKIIHNGMPKIYGDVVLIGQLFQNLVGNAIKFKGDKKPEIHISSKRQNGDYLFSIKDNGIGIQKEYREKIFIIFQRLNNREKYPGTGIGLSICRKIVERHGGKIWVESEPDKGSCFYFTIKAQ